jgi:hypothetical protein
MGIPTTGNIPETTEKLGCPTDNIPDNRFFKILNFIIFIKNKSILYILKKSVNQNVRFICKIKLFIRIFDFAKTTLL